MVRLVAKLAVIPLLLFVGVSLWYGSIEEKLQATDSLKTENTVNKPEKSPISGDQADKGESSGEQQAESDKEFNTAGFEVIVSRNIFQAALDASENDSEPEPVKAKDLEETQLQLVLLGTVTGNRKDSRAIIVDKKERKQDIFHIGDAIQGALITQIDRGQVVIEVDGQPEVLKLKDREGGGPGPPPTAAARRAVASPMAGERTVPVARPRRRISFRNPGPSAAPEIAPQEPSVDEPEAPLSLDEEGAQEDGSPTTDPEIQGGKAGEEGQEKQQEEQQG